MTGGNEPCQHRRTSQGQHRASPTKKVRGLADRLGAQPGELLRLCSRLGEVVPRLDPPIVSDPGSERFALFEAMASLLTSIGGSAGTVLVLDDLHWASRPTLLLLRHVLRRTSEAPLLIVGTYRDTDVDRTHPLADLVADLRREPGVERLALAGLVPEEVEEFVVETAGHDLDCAARSWLRLCTPRHLATRCLLVRCSGTWLRAGQCDELVAAGGSRREQQPTSCLKGFAT